MKKKYEITFLGGESFWDSNVGVDYMRVTVEDADGEERELYAEISPADLADEQGNPAMLRVFDDDDNPYDYERDDEGALRWNPDCKDADELTIPYLVKAVREMCAEVGVDPESIEFWNYDSPWHPTYMMPGVEARCYIR